jgi:ATP-binding cassette, subfamily A (ABC1), member 3
LSKYGLGSAVPIARLTDVFDGSLALVWADDTNGTGVPSPDSIMSTITSGFTPAQLQGVKKVATPADIPSACPQNFNLFSECFAAVAFNDLPAIANDTHSINYTIRADGGLYHIDVVRHSSDFERRILPLQWDQASRSHARLYFH